jgi:hypothetical protein
VSDLELLGSKNITRQQQLAAHGDPGFGWHCSYCQEIGTREHSLADPGLDPASLESIIAAVLDKFGELMARAIASEKGPLADESGMITGRGERSYEGRSGRDFLTDMILRVMERPPDYAIPEADETARRCTACEGTGRKKLGRVTALCSACEGKGRATMTAKWTRTVLRNRTTNASRDLKRHARIQQSGKKLAWWAERTCQSAEAAALANIQHEENMTLLRRLPPKLRAAAMLRYDGYSIAETADVLSITYDAAYKRLSTIRSERIMKLLGLAGTRR